MDRLDGLLDPAAYPHRPSQVELRETHISRVFLAGDLVYKIKKPLRLPFLDYGTLERRHAMCSEEIRLNRRLAPDVYRRVCAVVPSGAGVRIAGEDEPGAIEYAVEMRRYDEGATLDRRVRDGLPAESQVRAVGRRLASFHAGALVPHDPERAVAALQATLRENFETLRGLVTQPADRARIASAERVAATVLAARGDQLLRRAGSGRVRDGHGDLRAEHVVLEHGIEIVDCVEFDRALREIDVGFDLAFLVMDLMRRDRRLSRALLDAYREAGGDPGDDTLVDFLAAQRALIRAKVALVRAGQVEAADAARRRADAASLLDLADGLGWRVRLGPLAIVCGLAASGKSTLARELARRSGATVLSSDRVRKELLGMAPESRAPTGAYGPDVNRRTYAELGGRARELLAVGEPVIVDATFRFAADRAAFMEVVGDATGLWIECRAPAEVRAARAAARAHDPARTSDADAAIAAREEAEWDPLAGLPSAAHATVSTDGPIDVVLAALADVLDAPSSVVDTDISCAGSRM